MKANRSKELLRLLVEPGELARYYENHEAHDARTSNYPAMVSGLTTTIEVSEDCPACSGTGMRLLSKKRIAEYKRRIASADNPQRVREQMDEEATCATCEGRCVVLESTRVLDPDSLFTTIACPTCLGLGTDRHGDPCRYAGCLGGYVIPCSVKEKGSTKKGRLPRGATSQDGADFGSSGLALGDPVSAGISVDVAELMRTSERLSRVRERDPEAAEALAAEHGTEGNRWAATKWGRRFAVWPLTGSGKRLADEAARASRSGFLLSPIERIATVRQNESATTVPNIRWRALMRLADNEARELSARAHALLTECS